MRTAIVTVGAALALLTGCMHHHPASPGEYTEPPAGFSALHRKAQTEGAVRVIIRLPTTDASPAAVSSAQAEASAAMATAGVAAEPISTIWPLMRAEMTAAQLMQMRAIGYTPLMQEDRLARPTLIESVPLIGGPGAAALGADGTGAAVAILDTGVQASHPFFGGRVVAEACFSTTAPNQGASSVCPNGAQAQEGAGAARPCATPDCDHGTHVAGIAAGAGADFVGVAPRAPIIAVQVFSQFSPRTCAQFGLSTGCALSYTSDQIRGLDFVLRQARTRKVGAANMSLGGGRATGACDDDIIKQPIDDLLAAGVATVIAAGNDGFTDAVSRPGCVSSAVTVTATTKQDAFARFSNRASLVDLAAPGADILSAVVNGRFERKSGTSMAAPHVAGAFAALASRAPQAAPDDILAALQETGRAVGDARFSARRIMVSDAAQSLLRGQEPQAADASPAIAGETLAALAARAPDAIVQIIARLKPTAREAQDWQAAEGAARARRCTPIGRVETRGLLIVEGRAADLLAFSRSDAVSDVQIDAVVRPQ